MSDQRTEKATPQRKKKARESGDVVRSRELLSAAGTLAGLLTLGAVGATIPTHWKQAYMQCLRFAATQGKGNWGSTDLMTLVRLAILPAMQPVAFVLASASLAIVAVGLGQNGFAFHVEALSPKFSRLNPATRVKDLFSVRALVRVAKSLVPAVAVTAMGWTILQHLLLSIPAMGTQRLPETFGAAFTLGIRAAWVMLAWSAIDYLVEWRAWNQRLKMSKQDMREEMKQAMGNPQIKGKIRSLQRQMARRKAKADMRRASVVITNPTHYAVALEFSFETMLAPTVLTKGRDLHALDIREEARWAGVPIIENPPLARSLYRAAEPGQAIPYELYSAVAGILAWLFREAQESRMRDARRSAQARAEHTTTNAQPKPFAGGI